MSSLLTDLYQSYPVLYDKSHRDYKNNLIKGTRLEEKHFVALRPGDGISPMKIDFFIGKKLNNDVELYQKCNLKDII